MSAPQVPIHRIMRSQMLLVQCVLVLWSLLTPSLATASVPQKSGKVPAGFATTRGRDFEVDGKPFVSRRR